MTGKQKPRQQARGEWAMQQAAEERALRRKPPILDPRFEAILPAARRELDRQTAAIPRMALVLDTNTVLELSTFAHHRLPQRRGGR